MVKYGIIQTENFNPENYSEVVKSSFVDIVVNEVDYKMLFAFSDYFNEHFDRVFDIDEYNKWILEAEWKYFLIPLDLVSAISHYSGFVKQTFPDFIFDVVLENQLIPVEGEYVEVPVNQIKMIPCNCTHWTDEGLMLLDAVVENWNVTYPNKLINFEVKFESFELFKTFMDSHL